MKANEAPEKLYVDTEDGLSDSILYGFTQKRKEDDIEYVRKDAFIEKACEFLKSYRQDIYDGQGYIAGIVNDETIEDFKKYMEE